MASEIAVSPTPLPRRFERPGVLRLLVMIGLVWFLVSSFQGAQISPGSFIEGLPYMGEILSEMFPPDISRVGPLTGSLFETFQMAFVGTFLGIVVSFFLALFATRSQTPNILLYYLTRGIISLFRTVPDLVWALFFVATVGLGPFAGTLALMIDTIGFCGRFFSEAMEEVDPGPVEALSVIGGGWLDKIFCAVVPAALPSFINTSLFSLEKATRSSVVLGLVGAGGIGIELKVAMDMFRYDQACTIILCIFLLVLVVEQVSSTIRARIIGAE